MPSGLCCTQQLANGIVCRLIIRHCMIELRESALAYTWERNMNRREFLSVLGTRRHGQPARRRRRRKGCRGFVFLPSIRVR
jgi:hypothetical protein